MAMEPTKPRVWSEEEIKLLIELAHLKMSAPAIAKQLGRHIASVRRRAHQLGLLLPAGRREPQERAQAGSMNPPRVMLISNRH
ncbi:hypothetical protein [Bradyrhizobium iriomotense]|uniref:GcrA cell cycle regulator n=1 Tax=Bradyrhizobium iriomotense TaxID=441950 RepID=A0ABQ6AXC5_9BRAD|nr:hypothetical protein [Bradyrhizobium iriomotense]GLR86844.1 hypothetical protein GCM10007857_35550 [Bradyrhizobium iriomotense]